MAQPVDAGGFFPLFDDHLNYQGSTYPSKCGGGGGGGGAGRPPLYRDDYTEYDSDDTSPYSPRPQAWVLRQSHEREGGHVPGLRWSPSPEPEHQFFIIREGTPTSTPPLPPRDLHLQPNIIQPTAHRQPHYRHHHQHHQHLQHHHHNHHHYPPPPPPPPTHETIRSPSPVACFMERTHSGRTIVTEPDLLEPSTDPATFEDSDDSAAALRVEQHLATTARGRHERILRTLINPGGSSGRTSTTPDFKLDNAALESIFSAADALFFQGRLSRRVQWEWSHGAVNLAGGGDGGGGGGGGNSNSNGGNGGNGSNGSSGSRIIGTTALRKAEGAMGGYETLIVLSSPILTDTQYNRRLLISTFLHELIHSYLFIRCGFKARHCGGHTKGFRAIAATIDRWEGQGSLRLSDVEADLAHFREEVQPSPPHTTWPPAMEEGPVCRHRHGGSDLYDARPPAAAWSTGPRVVFGAHEHGGEGRWAPAMPVSRPSPSVSAAASSTLVEMGGWSGYDGLDAVPRFLEGRRHTFTGTPMQSYPMH